MNISDIKIKQLSDLENFCNQNNIDYKSIKLLLEAEKIKKLQRKNHYIYETIDNEIEKILNNESR